MSSRFKNLGFGSKRKSSANIQTTLASPNGSTSTANTPPPANSSQTSLPPPGMNQNQLGRPPSYTYNTSAGRPNSPLPPGQQQHMAPQHPPPIDTRQGFGASNPQLGPQPPQYGGAYPQGQPQPLQYQQGAYNRPAEVEGAGKSKAQLIVGIDFVSLAATQLSSLATRKTDG